MSRFVDVTENDMVELLENRTSKKTKETVHQGKKIFLEFLDLKGIKEEDLATMERGTLDSLLCEFYPSLRKKDGELLKISSIKAYNYGLNEFMKETYKVDITDEALFPESHKMFQSVKVNLKKKVVLFTYFIVLVALTVEIITCRGICMQHLKMSIDTP